MRLNSVRFLTLTRDWCVWERWPQLPWLTSYDRELYNSTSRSAWFGFCLIKILTDTSKELQRPILRLVSCTQLMYGFSCRTQAVRCKARDCLCFVWFLFSVVRVEEAYTEKMSYRVINSAIWCMACVLFVFCRCCCFRFVCLFYSVVQISVTDTGFERIVGHVFGDRTVVLFENENSVWFSQL